MSSTYRQEQRESFLAGYIKRANNFLMLEIGIDRNEEQKNDLG